VYVFEAKVVRYARDRCIIYLPRECREKPGKHHGKMKVLVMIESNVLTK